MAQQTQVHRPIALDFTSGTAVDNCLLRLTYVVMCSGQETATAEDNRNTDSREEAEGEHADYAAPLHSRP